MPAGRQGASLIERTRAPTWVWRALDEVPSGYTLTGGAIIIAAITCQVLSGARHRHTPLPMV